MTVPPAAHLASVPPHPNSMSSGWAPMARARRRNGQVGRHAATTGQIVYRNRAGTWFRAGHARELGHIGRPVHVVRQGRNAQYADG